MRKTLELSQKEFAEIANIGPRYLANIENSDAFHIKKTSVITHMEPAL